MGKKLYVGNMSYDVDNAALEQLFAAHGTVESVNIISDRATGRSKGFGFVEMGSDEEAKAAAMEAATVVAGEVPLRVVHLCRDAARLAQTIAAVGNVNAATDAAVGAIMARAAAEGAGLNVRINSIALKDRARAEAWRAEVATLLAEVNDIAAAAVATATGRGGF